MNTTGRKWPKSRQGVRARRWSSAVERGQLSQPVGGHFGGLGAGLEPGPFVLHRLGVVLRLLERLERHLALLRRATCRRRSCSCSSRLSSRCLHAVHLGRWSCPARPDRLAALPRQNSSPRFSSAILTSAMPRAWRRRPASAGPAARGSGCSAGAASGATRRAAAVVARRRPQPAQRARHGRADPRSCTSCRWPTCCRRAASRLATSPSPCAEGPDVSQRDGQQHRRRTPCVPHHLISRQPAMSNVSLPAMPL